MKLSEDEIHGLEEWLSSRLGALVAHTEKVRTLLQAVNAPAKIIESATEVVLGDEQPALELSPQQLVVWKAMLPLVAEHGLLAVKGGGLPGEDHKALSKREAAEYLGISQRKLQRHMKKRQIDYEKYGTGQTASVRFRRTELERFRKSREVPAKKGETPS